MGCLLKQGGGLYARLRVGAVLLAAGEGSRLGKVPKCLLSLQGVPLIKRHMIALSGAGVDEVVVVTGYYHAEVEPAVASVHAESGVGVVVAGGVTADRLCAC